MAVIVCHTIHLALMEVQKMLEKEIERKLVQAVKLKGGLCLKFTSNGYDGVPDRLVLLPKGKLAFVELKAPGKKTRPLQIKRIKQLSTLGFACYVIDNHDAIGGVIHEIQSS